MKSVITLLLVLLLFASKANAANGKYPLYPSVQLDDNYTFFGPIRRHPAKPIFVWLSNQSLSFPAFISNANIRIMNGKGETVFDTEVSAGETTCAIPCTIQAGNYTLSLTTGSFLYVGTIII